MNEWSRWGKNKYFWHKFKKESEKINKWSENSSFLHVLKLTNKLS